MRRGARDGGWSAKVTLSHLATPVVTDEATVTDAVSKVVCSGGQIRPDEYQSLAVDARPIPDGIKQLPFSVVQTYSDCTVVRRPDPTPANGEEPEHPAPTIAVRAAGGGPRRAGECLARLRRAGAVGAALAPVAAVVALVLAARRRPAG